MEPISFLSPQDVLKALANQAKARRLAENFSRKTLAERSGVPEPTIRRFEMTGMIGLAGLLKIAEALGCLEEFGHLFSEKKPLSIDQVLRKPRIRGTR